MNGQSKDKYNTFSNSYIYLDCFLKKCTDPRVKYQHEETVLRRYKWVQKYIKQSEKLKAYISGVIRSRVSKNR